MHPTVQNRVGDQRDRLDCRVHGKLLDPAFPHGVHARIIPNVGAVAAVFAELDVVDMRGIA